MEERGRGGEVVPVSGGSAPSPVEVQPQCVTGALTLPFLSSQNASTFEDVATVSSAYQRTVPVEAGASQRAPSTPVPQEEVVCCAAPRTTRRARG